MARSMLIYSELPKFLWAEAVNTAVHIRNRCPTHALQYNITPFECWYGYEPDVSGLRIFCSTAIALKKGPSQGIVMSTQMNNHKLYNTSKSHEKEVSDSVRNGHKKVEPSHIELLKVLGQGLL
ncbi:uncharacterized protein [Chelonus insularis]|uniref:uncharacterized protein n=1 Tax=Chelonus insularis TaxID=460826 RepID=UPI00158E06CE|nr:uncharacterized protein LOC118064828 [Chelonus insularis]